MRTACLVAAAGVLSPTYGFIAPSFPVSGGTFAPTTHSSSASSEAAAGWGGVSGLSMMAKRVPFIAGNWKMNPTELDAAIILAKEVAKLTKGTDEVEVGIIPPHPFLVPVAQALKGSGIQIGAQNVYIEEKGAYTGAVSTTMLKSVGVDYVLVGHSERRTIFREHDGLIQLKMRKVLDAGMSPILCIGESKEEYESGLNKEICAVQLGKDLMGVTGDEMEKVVIAYEPVWAIGTGLTATPAIAQEVHAYIRSWLAEKYGKGVADKIRIQYGGSVTPESVDELMACPDIDGALVGGASLVADKFARICQFKAAVMA